MSTTDIGILKELKIQIITLSDRASTGEYADLSGPRIAEIIQTYCLSEHWRFHIGHQLIPDDATQLRNIIFDALKTNVNILFTTGGTGSGPRDITVDTIKPLLSHEIPGIMEMIRVKYGATKPNALLSRSIAGFIDQMLIYTLPGSLKAVDEYMQEILKTMKHLIYMRYGLDVH